MQALHGGGLLIEQFGYEPARFTVFCSGTRQFTLTVPVSTQMYKWVAANLMLGGHPVMD